MIHKILCFLGLHSFAHTMKLRRVKLQDMDEITVYVPVSRCIFCNKEV